MKKIIYSLLMLALPYSFISCTSDDPEIPEPENPENPNNPDNPDDPDDPENPDQPIEPESFGVFVVNSGNLSGNIAGSLSYLNFSEEKIFNNVFQGANKGQVVGDTFNSGIVYGNYIFLAVTGSSVIHVIDRESYAVVKTISTNPDAGPRQLETYDGKLYATLFGQPGYVIEIDIDKLEITREVEVGPLPECIKAFEDKLYVAVSDGYSSDYKESCIAVIDPSTMKITEKIDGIINPVQICTTGKELFVNSWGRYDDNWMQVDYGIYEIVEGELKNLDLPGIYMAANDNSVYYINAAYGAAEITYNVYDVTEGKTHQWIGQEDGVDSPNGIGVDPITGNVFILSCHLGEGGYVSYRTPGYIQRYAADGKITGTFDTGVGPTNMFFNYVK